MVVRPCRRPVDQLFAATEAILQSHLPDAPWRPLVVSFGYCVGFIMVVLSRQQLFTESTITVVLPVMADFTPRNLARMGRLWAIVLGANFVGTLVAALFCSFTPVLSPELKGAMLAISRDLLAHGWVEVMFKGLPPAFSSPRWSGSCPAPTRRRYTSSP